MKGDKISKNFDAKKWGGAIKIDGDPMEIQNKLRSEWDRDSNFKSMEATLLIEKINILPNSLKDEVNDFVDFLISKKIKVKDKKLEDFSGIWTNEEADEIEKIIFDASTVESPIKAFDGIDPVKFIREIRDEE